MTSYLTTPQAEKTQRIYYYKCELACELASNELELDSYGITVPKNVKTVDVVVNEPGVEVIASFIAAVGWLSEYRLVAHWIPSDCTEF